MKVHKFIPYLLCLTALSVPARHAVATPIFQQLAPLPGSYVFNVDFGQLDYSPIGDVTAAVSAVDVFLGLGNTATSGCEAVDFVGFFAGNIALMQRGACTFEVKALNAEAAGAAGVLIFNQGDTVARQDLFTGSLEAGFTGSIPVFSLPYALGEAFASSAARAIVRMASEEIEETNVPAPTTITLFGLGLAGLGWLRRKKI